MKEHCPLAAALTRDTNAVLEDLYRKDAEQVVYERTHRCSPTCRTCGHLLRRAEYQLSWWADEVEEEDETEEDDNE